MQSCRILVIEDDQAIAKVITVALSAEGATVDAVDTIARRNVALATKTYDAVITDVMLPDGNGLADWADVATGSGKLPPVIVLSAQNTLDTALRASEQGAFEYLPKPFDLDDLIAAVRSAVSDGEGVDRGQPPSEEDNVSGLPIIGRAAAMQMVYRTLARVAPTDLSVLILGESGTGKELVAHALHKSSQRRAAPFVAVNMAAIPRELIETELFGHERGAFTGAVARTSGRFEQAEGGTLFLDEIGDMPIEAQTRLLRVLQSGDYSPVGSSRVQRANVRILAATNQDLLRLVQNGRFREDLYYRLNVIPIALPPLRERRSDIALLAEHFMSQSVEIGLPRKAFTAAALASLSAHDWPGNVRELGNVVQRLALLTRGQEVGADDVHRILEPETGLAGGLSAAQAPDALLSAAVERWLASPEAIQFREEGSLHARLTGLVERIAIEAVLRETGGNQLRSAALLGINRNTLRLKRQDAEIAVAGD